VPNVRTTCPTCDVVIVEASALTVRLRVRCDESEAVFTCPGCWLDVVLPLDENMIPVLIGAGCPVAPDGGTDADLGLDPAGPGRSGWHPAFGPEISDAEIDRFVDELDRLDWFDELAH